MNQPSVNLPEGLFDPNPADPAAYFMRLSAEVKTMVELNRNEFAELTNLIYGGECPEIIIERCLDQLSLYGSTIIYTGTLKQCLAYQGSFSALGMSATVNAI